jgi:cbb3-type cytochrome oxidase subunit 3
MSDEWVAIYKFGRLAVLALALCGIAVHLYRAENRERYEEPARRMLEDDE